MMSFRGAIGDAVNYLTWFYSASEYFPAFAGFSPRIVALLTAGIEIFNLRTIDDMVITWSIYS